MSINIENCKIFLHSDQKSSKNILFYLIVWTLNFESNVAPNWAIISVMFIQFGALNSEKEPQKGVNRTTDFSQSSEFKILIDKTWVLVGVG